RQRARGFGPPSSPLPGDISADHPLVVTPLGGYQEKAGIRPGRHDTTSPGEAAVRDSARAMILPLALAQFICSYAATNMNVAISAIAEDLHTDVAGVQTAITMFTLTMAAL